MSTEEGPPNGWKYPDWDSGGKVHNWKNYVSQGSRDLWYTLSDECKLELAKSFQNIADNEEWE